MKRNGVLFCVAAIGLVLLVGCGQTEQKQAREIDRLACTGMRLEGETVIRYYHDDGSEYITRQKHNLCVTNRGFLAKASEPQGRFIWKLTGERFMVQPDNARSKELLSRLEARAISTSMLAGAGFIGKSGAVTREPVYLSGQWYIPVEVTDPSALWARETLFVNRSSSTVDFVRIENIATGETVSTRVFNYGFVDGLDSPVPMTIEVYGTDVDSIDPEKVMDVTYSRIILDIVE